MTTYTFDPTGVATANKVTNETQTVTTIGSAVPVVINLNQLLFYATGVTISYTDVLGGASRTLTLGDDYNFLFEIDNVASNSSKIFAAVVLNNLQLNGTISVGYQAVGGQWTFIPQKWSTFLATNYYSSRQGYLSLMPALPVYASGQTVPIVLNSAAALSAVQAGAPNLPCELVPVIVSLPNSRKFFVEGGLVIDGNGVQKVV